MFSLSLFIYTPLYENEQKWEWKTPIETTKNRPQIFFRGHSGKKCDDCMQFKAATGLLQFRGHFLINKVKHVLFVLSQFIYCLPHKDFSFSAS